MTDPKDNLMPCPFCGGDVYVKKGEKSGFMVEHKFRLLDEDAEYEKQYCPVIFGRSFWLDHDYEVDDGEFTSKEDAITAWNTRHTDPDMNVIKRSELEKMKPSFSMRNDRQEWREGYRQAIDDMLKGWTE